MLELFLPLFSLRLFPQTIGQAGLVAKRLLFFSFFVRW